MVAWRVRSGVPLALAVLCCILLSFGNIVDSRKLRFSSSSAQASAQASAGAGGAPWGWGPPWWGPGWGGSSAQASAQASAGAGGGWFGFAARESPSSKSVTLASSVSAAQASDVLVGRLGLGGESANSASEAVTKSAHPATAAFGKEASGAPSSGSAFALSGGGLTGLAGCGVDSKAVASALSCRSFTAPAASPLCALAGQMGTTCQGLQLINPGQDQLAVNQAINVPPCNFAV